MHSHRLETEFLGKDGVAAGRQQDEGDHAGAIGRDGSDRGAGPFEGDGHVPEGIAALVLDRCG